MPQRSPASVEMPREADQPPTRLGKHLRSATAPSLSRLGHTLGVGGLAGLLGVRPKRGGECSPPAGGEARREKGSKSSKKEREAFGSARFVSWSPASSKKKGGGDAAPRSRSGV